MERNSKMSVIFVLTHTNDDCAEMVLNHFKKMGVDYLRFNTEEFQKIVRCSIKITSNGSFSGVWHFPDRNLYFEEIGVIWNRRVHDPEIKDEFSDPELLNLAREESKWTLNIAFTLINAPVMNPWEINERLKFNKWIQMKRATELGLEIPYSCLTNNLDSIKLFWEQTNQDMILKKIRKGLLTMKDGKRFLIHTSKIPPESFTEENLHRMRFCPMFLQKHIPKKYDVRSIVIGENVFSVAIHSQDIPEGITDYRTAGVLGKLDQMKHERIFLGNDIDSKLISFVKSFGLHFSAFDLVITPDERIIFLEDNPNGQWAWLEQMTGTPISMAFAEYIANNSKR